MKKVLFLAPVIGVVVTPAYAQDAETVTQLFLTTFESACDEEEGGNTRTHEVNSWELTWRYDEAEADSTATLYEFICESGAYNTNYVYYLVDEVSILPVALAIPEIDVSYEDGDEQSIVRDISLTGYATQLTVANATFDPETGTITSFEKWRGPGDASSSGTWVFKQGRFSLVSYDVDASYDGEVNPERLVDFE